MLHNAIDFDLLRAFADVAAARTFAEAAARRRVTPSAVSQQMKALEGQLGTALFERVGRRARLTEAGARLAASVGAGFASLDAALEELEEDRGQVRGIVRVGGPGPFCRAWLLPRIAPLLAAHPELVLDLVFGTPSALAPRLAAGGIDLLLVNGEVLGAGLGRREVFVEVFVAVASPGYLKKRPRPRDASSIAADRFVVFDEDLAMHAPWWRAAFGARAPMRFVTAARVASLDGILALAEAGVGVAVLPNYFVEAALEARRLVSLPLAAAPKRPARSPIWLAWRKGAPETPRLRVVREALTA